MPSKHKPDSGDAVREEDILYLDNSATTPMDEAVLARVTQAMRTCYFNPSAAYAPAVDAERAMTQCREALLHAAGAQGYEVVFTAGGTEADNLAILGAAGMLRAPGVLCYSAVEHPAVREAMRAAQAMGHAVRVLPVDAQGRLDLAACAPLLDESTTLISCMQVNNETGAIQPLEELAALRAARCPRALLHADGVQGFLRAPTRLASSGIDLYALSAHKLHGPKGVGALLVRKGVRLRPLLYGGGQEGGLRGGTENLPGIVGLHAALEGPCALPDAVQRVRAMKQCLWESLRAHIPGVQVNGPAPDDAQSAPHILNISLPGVRGEVMLHALEAHGVYVSTGSACAARRKPHSETLAAMGIAGDRLEGALRLSLSPLNTQEQMPRAAQAIAACWQTLQRFKRR